ncbi:MAG TPA: helix-turn-helix domain-containing protein, partial [Thermogutta sp.]|nr:helix-turn-helix domain-containing protein [Thermogutta sp.]
GNITADVVRAEMAYFPIKDMKGTAAKLMPSTFQDAINQAERELLEKALREAGGNKTAAAAALGMKPYLPRQTCQTRSRLKDRLRSTTRGRDRTAMKKDTPPVRGVSGFPLKIPARGRISNLRVS